MNILVTGSDGFIGKNLISLLKHKYKYNSIITYDKDNTLEELAEYTKACDFVFHLAGVNRATKEEDFKKGNVDLTEFLVSSLKNNKNKAPIVITSSIQAEQDNVYGLSKKRAEEILTEYKKFFGTKIYIYRLPNVFGKWSRPNYNSVVSTFCHNIANDLEVFINDRESEINLVHIDDVVTALIKPLLDSNIDDAPEIKPYYKVTVGRLADIIYSFKSTRKALVLPDLNNDFIRKLYSTYLTFLPHDKRVQKLEKFIDHRGFFSELFRINSGGQVSLNSSNINITKGDHWHSIKHEKFIVVSGKALIKTRDIYSNDTIEYILTGEELSSIDIVAGSTHNITNIGNQELLTIMWANEYFSLENTDTYYLKVEVNE